MLFVPWVYRELERKRIAPPHFAAKARQMEMALVGPLLQNEDQTGIFGRIAGKALKRLPSSVYWNGLGAWGIRLVSCSQDEYHRYIDEIYRRRDSIRGRSEEDNFPEPETLTWHPRLPDPPDGFPDKIEDLNFNLEPDEASFLLDRILKTQEGSLLAHLAVNCKPVECDFPWQHPDRERFSQEHKDILNYAEFFSTIMHGAAFLYNLMLAELAGRKELQEEHRDNLVAWKARLRNCQSRDLPLEGLWELITGKDHTITRRTKEFVTAWVRHVRATGGDVANDDECRKIVSSRERQLKGIRSRFTNSRARDQWKGYAGVGQMTYRWPNVKRLLVDLHAGLKKGNVES